MALDRKLEAWTAAGLIDEAAAARIRAFEGEESRPVALWALVGLGLLALALGIMLIIGANWDRIPGWLKLGVQLALTAVAAGTTWLGIKRGDRWLAEGSLFVLGALVLGGIALHAQVYQLVGPLWQALALWLVLLTPAMLLAGTTRLVAYTWSLMLLWGFGSGAMESDATSSAALLVDGLAMAAPALLILVSLLPRAGEVSRAFRSGIAEIGIVALLAGASLAHFAWAESIGPGEAGDMLVRMLLPAGAALAAVLVGQVRGGLPKSMLLPILAWPTLAVGLAAAVPHGNGWFSRFIGALIFAAMWGLIGHGASRAGWRVLFGVAIAAIAVRLFIVYFELFGTLAMTGTGLVLAGILLIGLALAWRRLFRLVGEKP
jgi:uncharacterized membrane protein